MDLATKLSWNGPYQGKNWKTMRYKIQDIIMCPSSHKHKYAHQFSLVQSSGTGKSSMIDEYSKDPIILLLCLRDEQETGEYYLT